MPAAAEAVCVKPSRLEREAETPWLIETHCVTEVFTSQASHSSCENAQPAAVGDISLWERAGLVFSIVSFDVLIGGRHYAGAAKREDLVILPGAA